MEEEWFLFNMRILEVGGCDIVLGIDWIYHFTHVILNNKPLRLSFVKEGGFVTLMGQ